MWTVEGDEALTFSDGKVRFTVSKNEALGMRELLRLHLGKSTVPELQTRLLSALRNQPKEFPLRLDIISADKDNPNRFVIHLDRYAGKYSSSTYVVEYFITRRDAELLLLAAEQTDKPCQAMTKTIEVALAPCPTGIPWSAEISGVACGHTDGRINFTISAFEATGLAELMEILVGGACQHDKIDWLSDTAGPPRGFPEFRLDIFQKDEQVPNAFVISIWRGSTEWSIQHLVEYKISREEAEDLMQSEKVQTEELDEDYDDDGAEDWNEVR